uniref:Uncharacterized protein n=1 Tax=Schizaphis graminum TaxID=13262 RepID=A0A2S2PA95_SCHGA
MNNHFQNNSSTTLMMNKNNSNYLDRHKPQENHVFGGGHIIRQYMSGVGVITERYIPDYYLLFFESESTSDQSTFISDVKSLEYLIEEEEPEEKEEKCNSTIPKNCPCYDKAWKKELRKNRSFKNIFSSVFQTTISKITKLSRFTCIRGAPKRSYK